MPICCIIGDVQPGEAIFVSLKGEVQTMMCHDKPVLAPCIFEYVYFGRPDSTMDGVSVYEARKEVKRLTPPSFRMKGYPGARWY